MSTEIQMLIFSAILGIVQILLAATMTTMKRGPKWNTGARDEVLPPVTGKAGRLDRALQNFKETFPIFAVAVLAVFVTNRTSEMTVLGAQMYFIARVIYVPVYYFGIPFVRTLIWLASMVGIGLLLGAMF